MGIIESMYRTVRAIHRWLGLAASLFLLTIAITGFLLATKGSFGWIRPPEQDGAPIDGLGETIGLDAAAQAAFAQNLGGLASVKDIDRIDYRPKRNVYKVVSKENYHEVQVCGKTGDVLQTASRVDQLSEDIHDLSFLSDGMHTWVLPLVAICLCYLSASGMGMFMTPVVRRWRFKKRGAVGKA